MIISFLIFLIHKKNSVSVQTLNKNFFFLTKRIFHSQFLSVSLRLFRFHFCLLKSYTQILHTRKIFMLYLHKKHRQTFDRDIRNNEEFSFLRVNICLLICYSLVFELFRSPSLARFLFYLQIPMTHARHTHVEITDHSWLLLLQDLQLLN